jgi:thioredoxin 2
MKNVELDERGVIVNCNHCGQRNRLSYERLTELPRCAKCHTPLKLPAEPIEIQDESTFNALTLRSTIPVLIDFWAAWCGPCKMVAPEVAKVSAESGGRFVVAKLDTEKIPAAAGRLGVNAIPLFILFKAGREVARQAGALPASGIRQFVNPHL